MSLQLDPVGAAAVQQTLEALGVQADSINTTADDGHGSPASPAAAPLNLAGVVAAIERTNDLLAAILAALETRPVTPYPTY